MGQGDVLAGIRGVYGGIRGFTSLNTSLLGPDHLWTVCRRAENPDYYTLTLTETEAGPVVSSESLAKLGGSRTSVSNDTVLRIDHQNGPIETHPSTGSHDVRVVVNPTGSLLRFDIRLPDMKYRA